ncbi:MAG: glycosyltransferase family 4 protein [Candidatus Levybacteria bacterium]|nr:glycosyltransferase family 4 protein [Candidatus Levybacteria bacterium]
MKIGIFDPYLDDLGGGEKYMITLAQCLSNDNNVTIFWDNKEDLKKVAQRFSLDISKITLRSNIFSPKYSFIKRCLDSLGYDAIVVLSDGSIPFLLSKKLFIHFQQPFPEIKMSLKTNFKRMRVSSFFCNSIFTKTFIDKEFKIESRVIYPPVGTNFKENKKENIILHAGRFRAVNIGFQDYKKQELMIDIFKEMVDKGIKNWKFILAVGVHETDRSKFNHLQKKAEGYPIEFLINLNYDDLGKVYSKSKIYWHASGYGENLDKNPELAEHFGISTVEAMGAGVVPVVINAGGQKEIVENGKNGYLWQTLTDFAEKTNRLIKDVSLLNKMSKEAIMRSKIFTGDRFCREVKDTIK